MCVGGGAAAPPSRVRQGTMQRAKSGEERGVSLSNSGCKDESIAQLWLTAAHHDDQEFYTLGPVEAEVPLDRLFAALPTSPPHVCDEASICWIVDAWSADRHDPETGHTILGGIFDDREVSRDVAERLLGRNLAAALREQQEQLRRLYAGGHGAC